MDYLKPARLVWQAQLARHTQQICMAVCMLQDVQPAAAAPCIVQAATILVHTGTEEHAKALSDAKSVVPITNLAPRKQRSKSVDAEVEPDDNSFLTAALFK